MSRPIDWKAKLLDWYEDQEICGVHGGYFKDDQEKVGIESGCPFCFLEDEHASRRESA